MILQFIIKITILACGLIGVFVGHKYFNAKDDNALEEMVEQQIQEQMGIKIYLTPDSPENSSQLKKE